VGVNYEQTAVSHSYCGDCLGVYPENEPIGAGLFSLFLRGTEQQISAIKRVKLDKWSILA
jgi:hypothetical protein